MPHDSLYRRLGRNDEERERNADALFANIQEHGLDTAIGFALGNLGVDTSRAALSRFNVAMKAQKAEDAMLDKLAQRTARTKAISAKIKDTSPLISPETIRALDQLVFEIVAINPDDPRLERLVGMAKTLSQAADSNKNTEAAARALELREREYNDKVAAAKAAITSAITKGGISAETRAEIEERLKLL